jgi:hypothetical protein
MRSAGWHRDFRTPAFRCYQIKRTRSSKPASALVALDRRDLDAAWSRAHAALEAQRVPKRRENSDAST